MSSNKTRLVVRRKAGENIGLRYTNEKGETRTVIINVYSLGDQTVKLGIDAPPDLRILPIRNKQVTESTPDPERRARQTDRSTRRRVDRDGED